MAKEKYTIEYSFKSSPKILYNRISTPSGLSEWFADDVNSRGNIFTFFWEQSEQTAKLLGKKDQKYIRFHWLDDEDDNSYFEFKISINELTGDTALIITDFAYDEDEREDAIELWDQQIQDLRNVIGG